MTEYDKKQAEDIFMINALAGIPEETTALAIARRCQKEAEWVAALANWKKGSGYGYRRRGESLADLLTDVCTRREDVVRYDGTPRVHDYDEKHLLIEEISSVDAEGNGIESHPQVWVMKDEFRNEKGEIMFFTPYQAIRHCEQEGYVLPPSQLTCAIVAACFLNKENAEAEKVLVQYRNHGNGNGLHVLNTLVDYGKAAIISYPQDADFPSLGGTDNVNHQYQKIVLPFEKTKKRRILSDLQLQSMNLEDGLKDELVSRFVRQYSGLPDPEVLVEVGKYFGKTAYALISPSNETQAAWFGCYSINLSLNGSGNLGGCGAARGVRFVAP